jgi:hypothetical protein
MATVSNAPTTFIQPVVPPAGMTFCARCGEPKPPEGFDLKDSSTGRRDKTCGKCRQVADRIRRLTGADTAYQRKIKEDFVAWVAQLNADHPNVPTISTITAELIAGLGGVRGMVAQWVGVLMSDKTSAKHKLDGFKAIANFCAQAGEQNKAVDGLRNMSTEQLNSLIMSLVVEDTSDGGGGDYLLETLKADYAKKGFKLLLIEEASIVEEPAAIPAPVEPTTEAAT